VEGDKNNGKIRNNLIMGDYITGSD